MNDASILTNVVDCHEENGCVLLDGLTLAVTKKGVALLLSTVDGVSREIELNDVYYSPKLARNLIS